VKNSRRDVIKLMGALGALGLAPLSFQALGAANEVATFVVGFPAGGSPDILSRAIAEVLSRHGWTIVVENRTGASGRIAVDYVRRAKPADKVVLITPIEILTLLPHVYRDVRFDVFKDFAPVAGLSESPYGLAVSPQLGVDSIAELIEWYKAHPDQATYATPGEGTPQHLLGAILSRDAGLKLLHVPYRGGPPAIADVMGGQVPCVITSYGSLSSYQQAGSLKVLAYTATQPLASIPSSIPTFIQDGYPNIKADGSYLAVSSSEVDPAFVDAMGEALAAIVKTTEYKDLLARFGQEPLVIERSAIPPYMKESYDYWGGIVNEIGFEPL